MLIGRAFLRSPAADPLPVAAPATLSMHVVVVVTLGCFLAYDGWQYVAFVAGEVRKPSRSIPLALALGTGMVILLYVLANMAYFRVLPVSRIAASAAEQTMGPIGARAPKAEGS